MSDFDKEAEREKLRKKFADDEEKRASTQRMSELLLKGATMTNKHCSRCSDPLFRYDGQTFCPSCQAEGAEVDPQAEADSSEPDPERRTDDQPADPQDHEQRTDDQPADPQDHETRRPTDPVGATQPQPGRSTRAQAGRSTQPQTGQPVQPGAGESARPQAGRSAEPVSPVGGGRKKTGSAEVDARPTASAGDLSEARASLTRTLTRFARAAEETDDPRRGRELLAAAREAAATLAELE